MDKEAGQVLRGREIAVVIDLHIGRSSARVLTCDMTEEYIKVNATYRT
jgi:glutamate N-acetyltransferase/amino-acid N-acetyltransferase